MTVECKFADRRSTSNTGILVLEFAVENAGAGAAFACECQSVKHPLPGRLGDYRDGGILPVGDR